MTAASRFVFDRAPLRVYWEVTRACDLACRHCRAEAQPSRDPAELDTEQGLRLLERLAAFGHPRHPPPRVVLTGGDPLKRPDLFALIAGARARGLRVSVSPSATPLLTAAMLRQLKTAGVEAISLSLDGSTASRHDRFRGFPGTFERTLAAARVAEAFDLPVQINTLVAADTRADLPAIYELVRDVGAARWSLFFLVAVGRGTVLRPVSAHECEALLWWLSGLGKQGKPLVTTTEAPHFRRVVRQAGGHGSGHAGGVRDGNGVLFISHTGDVTPAGFLPTVVGNVTRDDVVALYRDAPLFAALRAPDGFGGRCGRCAYRWECGGSRARALAATGDPLAEDPLCCYVPAREREL